MSEKPNDGYAWAKERGFWDGVTWFTFMKAGDVTTRTDQFRASGNLWMDCEGPTTDYVGHAVLPGEVGHYRRPVSARPDAELLEAMRDGEYPSGRPRWKHPLREERTSDSEIALEFLDEMFPEQPKVDQPIPAPAEEGESLVSILNDVIDDRGGQIVELTRKLSALTAKLAAAEGEVARLRSSCDHVSEIAAGRWVTMGKLADQVRDLTAERDAARKEAEGLRGELEAARNPKPSKTLCLPAMFHVVCDSCGKSFPRETHKQFDPCPECTQPGGTL